MHLRPNASTARTNGNPQQLCAAEAARVRAVVAAEDLSADLVEVVNSGASKVELRLLNLSLNASHSRYCLKRLCRLLQSSSV